MIISIWGLRRVGRETTRPTRHLFMLRVRLEREDEMDPQGQQATQLKTIRPITGHHISQRLASLLETIARRLSKIEPLIESQPDLRQITLVITLDKRGKPRTVILRTESKSDLPA